MTPLHLACEKGSIETIKILLARFNNLYGRDKSQMRKYLGVRNSQERGLTALHHAAGFALRSGNNNTIKLLLMYGADKHLKNDEGLTALEYFERERSKANSVSSESAHMSASAMQRE